MWSWRTIEKEDPLQRSPRSGTESEPDYGTSPSWVKGSQKVLPAEFQNLSGAVGHCVSHCPSAPGNMHFGYYCCSSVHGAVMEVRVYFGCPGHCSKSGLTELTHWWSAFLPGTDILVRPVLPNGAPRASLRYMPCVISMWWLNKSRKGWGNHWVNDWGSELNKGLHALLWTPREDLHERRGLWQTIQSQKHEELGLGRRLWLVSVSLHCPEEAVQRVLMGRGSLSLDQRWHIPGDSHTEWHTQGDSHSKLSHTG
jgi:hypothetical protein